MKNNKTTKPWIAGPEELLDHALEHLTEGNPFDFRIAMISIDNAVELAIKTFLGLPKRIRGTEGPTYKALQEASSSFPALLDLLEKFAKDRVVDLDLGDIEVYHRLRNTLYHDGNGITVDPKYADSYLQIAKVLLDNLLGIKLKKDESIPPSSSLGGLVSKWASLVQEVRILAKSHLGREEHLEEPILHTVDRLITRGVLDTQFRRRLRDANKIRNKLTHSISVPLDEKNVINLIGELNELLQYLKKWEDNAKIDANRNQEQENFLNKDSSQKYARLESIMPDLLTEMRNDLTEHRLSREFVILKKGWSYWASGNELVYYFEDHPDLKDKLLVLQNYRLIRDITYNNVNRYIISEDLAQYLLAEK
jgi:hypothetical protein